jgi:hypothetical protein
MVISGRVIKAMAQLAGKAWNKVLVEEYDNGAARLVATDGCVLGVVDIGTVAAGRMVGSFIVEEKEAKSLKVSDKVSVEDTMRPMMVGEFPPYEDLLAASFNRGEEVWFDPSLMKVMSKTMADLKIKKAKMDISESLRPISFSGENGELSFKGLLMPLRVK